MKKRTGAIPLSVVNVVGTILTGLFVYLLAALAFAFTPQEHLEENNKIFMITFSIIVGVDVLKWIAHYYVIHARKKVWLIFYIIYVVGLFIVSLWLTPWLFIIGVVYIFVLLYVNDCLEHEELRKQKE